MAPTTTLTVAITLGVLAACTALNVAGVRLLAAINNIGVAAEILGMGVLALVLLAAAHRHGLATLADTAGTGAGPSGYPGAFATAIFMSLFVVYGFDTAGTLAEETRDPTRQVPRAILAALGASFAVGSLFLVAAVLAIPNIRAAMASPTALVDIIDAGLPSGLAKLYLAVVTAAVFVCALSIQAATVRLAYGMARDGGLPGGRALRRVSPRFGTPATATLAVGGLAALPLLVSQQLSAIVTGATALIYLAYLLCNLALLRARLAGWPRRAAPFRLGRWGLAASVLAVGWGGAMLVNLGGSLREGATATHPEPGTPCRKAGGGPSGAPIGIPVAPSR